MLFLFDAAMQYYTVMDYFNLAFGKHGGLVDWEFISLLSYILRVYKYTSEVSVIILRALGQRSELTSFL